MQFVPLTTTDEDVLNLNIKGRALPYREPVRKQALPREKCIRQITSFRVGLCRKIFRSVRVSYFVRVLCGIITSTSIIMMPNSIIMMLDSIFFTNTYFQKEHMESQLIRQVRDQLQRV